MTPARRISRARTGTRDNGAARPPRFPSRRVLVIQHVPHEGPGTFAPSLESAGCALRTFRAAEPRAGWPALEDFDGLIVMGGPMGVNDQARLTFIRRELALLGAALARGTPVLGICLGAQLLAAALGARVTRAPQKEIGWYPLMREAGSGGDPLFAPFGQTETVFQWHGDTFELPRGAAHLASSPLCAHQAFRWGRAAYGVQFHVEVDEAMVASWLIRPGNRTELARLKGVIDPGAIRRAGARHSRRLAALAHHMATAFAALLAERPAAASRR